MCSMLITVQSMAPRAHFTSNTRQVFSPLAAISSRSQISPFASFRFPPPKTRKTTLRVHATTNSQSVETSRPLADFPRSKWGDHFASMSLDDSKFKSNSIQVEVLKEEVRKMLMTNTYDSVVKIDFINTLCRLGVSYHFEDEIGEQLHQIFVAEPELLDKNDYDLHSVALVFRVFRQHGFKMSCDVFGKFKDNDGKLKESLRKDAKGLLSLYEAAYLSTPGEDTLDEALAFTKVHLESMAAESSSHLRKEIINALKQPFHRGIPRIEARKYIDIYEGDGYRNETLLKFAKVDYNRVQFLYQQELRDISKWWKDTDIEREYPYARSRIVELYFWTVIVHFEPNYARARMMLGKLLAFSSIIDDTYDAYGTKEEHQCFTDAIERWDYDALHQLPGYMRKLYRALLDAFCEFEIDVAAEGRTYSVDYTKEEVKETVKSYNREAEWLQEDHVPSMEEYFNYALTTAAIIMLASVSFMGLGPVAGIKEFEWLRKQPRMIRAASKIGLLADDLVSHKDEQMRPHVASSVECYMKEHGVSEEKAITELRKMIENAWMEVNQECMKPTAEVPWTLLIRIVNILRVTDVLYKDVDAYTNPEYSETFITQLFIEPIPV